MSEELKKRNIPYVLMGDQTLPTGVKGKQVIFRYGWMSVKCMEVLGVIRKYKPDILYARDRQLFRGVQFVELWPVSLLSGI